MKFELIERAALGSTALLGSLYDARTDTFYGGFTVFKDDIPSSAKHTVDTPFSDVQYMLTDTYSDKFERLQVQAELQISILLGLAALTGSGNYLNNKKVSSRSVRGSLVYNLATKKETINVFNEDLKPLFSLDALNLANESTHFVTEVKWGANSMIELEYDNNENIDTTFVSGNLMAAVQYASLKIKGQGSADFKSAENMKNVTYKFHVFGDVLPEGEIPTTLETAVEFMRRVPQFVAKINSGKGKPIKYTLVPISTLRAYLGQEVQIDQQITKLEEDILTEIVHFFEAMDESTQKVYDIHADVERFSYCIKSDHRKSIVDFKHELTIHQIKVKLELAGVLKDVRSGIQDLEEIYKVLRKFMSHDMSPQNVSVKVKSWPDISERISFARKLNSKGVSYVGNGEKLSNLFDEYFGVKVVVLKFWQNTVELDSELWTSNKQLFFYDMQTSTEQRKYYVIDCELSDKDNCKNMPVSNVIQVFQNGTLIEPDLRMHIRKLQSQPLVKYLESPRECINYPKDEDLFPFASRCPKETCNNSRKYSWRCEKCGKLLRLGRDDYFYCDCGRVPANSTSFKCSDPNHGLNYVSFTASSMDQIISALRPPSEVRLTLLGNRS